MRKLRVWSWNVAGADVWAQLREGDVDAALLQEAPAPDGWPYTVAPDPAQGWHTAGWDTDRWPRRTMVAAASNRVALEPWRLLNLDSAAHRLLSDLSGLITGRADHRVIAAGESTDWDAIFCRTVSDRGASAPEAPRCQCPACVQRCSHDRPHSDLTDC